MARARPPEGAWARHPQSESAPVAVAAFDPAQYELGKQSGRLEVTVTHVLGFWIDSINGPGDVTGYFMYYPALAKGTSNLTSSAAFLRTVILVR